MGIGFSINMIIILRKAKIYRVVPLIGFLLTILTTTMPNYMYIHHLLKENPSSHIG